jgi:hypothetical protein
MPDRRSESRCRVTTAARPTPPWSSLLGLVQHLTDGERHWFGYHVAGEGADDFDFSMDVPPTRPVAAVLQASRDAIAASDAILARVSFDDLTAKPSATRIRPSAGWSRT